MSFDLINALVTFQTYINNALREYFDIFVLTYLDDILIFSTMKADHEEHVRLILAKFRQFQLFLNLEKCFFSVREIDFLDFLLSVADVAMKFKRVEIIMN